VLPNQAGTKQSKQRVTFAHKIGDMCDPAATLNVFENRTTI